MLFYIALAISIFLYLTLVIFGGLFVTLIDVYLPLGAILVYNMVMYLVFAVTAVLVLIWLVMLFRKLIKSHAVCILLAIAVMIPVALFPFSGLSARLGYYLNRSARESFVENFDIDSYDPIDVDTYYVGDLRISYSGSVIARQSDSVTKIMFFPSPDTDTVILYSTEEDGISDGFFYYSGLKNVKKLADNWYIAEYFFEFEID